MTDDSKIDDRLIPELETYLARFQAAGQAIDEAIAETGPDRWEALVLASARWERVKTNFLSWVERDHKRFIPYDVTASSLLTQISALQDQYPKKIRLYTLISQLDTFRRRFTSGERVFKRREAQRLSAKTELELIMSGSTAQQRTEVEDAAKLILWSTQLNRVIRSIESNPRLPISPDLKAILRGYRRIHSVVEGNMIQLEPPPDISPDVWPDAVELAVRLEHSAPAGVNDALLALSNVLAEYRKWQQGIEDSWNLTANPEFKALQDEVAGTLTRINQGIQRTYGLKGRQ